MRRLVLALAALLVGSVPGILIASQFTVRLPDRALRLALAGVLALSGIKLIDPPGADWILLAGFVVGGVVFVYWGVRELREQRRSVSRQALPTRI